MASLALGLQDSADKKFGSKYDERELPSYRNILEIVLSKLTAFLHPSKVPKSTNLWDVQALLLVVLQVLLPPIRGKPFWDLHLTKAHGESMLFAIMPSFDWISSDWIRMDENELKLVISNHKTSKFTGTTQYNVDGDLKTIFLYWINGRTMMRTSNDFVFIQPASRTAFNSSSFSRYFTRCSQDVLGIALNLQQMRRIFATGTIITLALSNALL